VDADIKGFFDHLSHAWLMRMLAERIDDEPFLRLIKKWLKAGVLDTDVSVRFVSKGRRASRSAAYASSWMIPLRVPGVKLMKGASM
jgi:retron-type reverse transcriptase